MKDQVIVVTGASGGIGAAFARLAGKAGARLVLAARRGPELREVAVAAAPDAVAVPTDVTRRDEVRALFERALEEFGHVDVWINNAGRGISKPVLQLGDDDLDAMMRVNVHAALYGMQIVVPHFQERGRGHLINVSSMLGRVPYVAARSAYNAAKHALNALTANLRMELRERWPHIHVSTVSPGVVATEFGLNALGGGFDSRQLPNAQPVGEVAQVLFELIQHPRADVYTRPGMRDWVVRYFAAEDMAAEEAKFPTLRPTS